MKEFIQEDIDRIVGIIKADDSEAARAELSDLHPADVAELLQQLDTEESNFSTKIQPPMCLWNSMRTSD